MNVCCCSGVVFDIEWKVDTGDSTLEKVKPFFGIDSVVGCCDGGEQIVNDGMILACYGLRVVVENQGHK